MYTVYCDRLTLHDPVLNDPAYLLINPVVSQEANKAGSFTFTIAANHANANAINRLQSVIQVYDDEKLIFRGRALNDTRTWDNSRKITCEEDLAFLNDTRVRPYTFTGTVAEYLAFLISQHNSQVPAAKQFVVGTVTVTDGSGSIRRSSTVYPTTWSELQEKLLDDYGGYLFVNWTGSVNRIDYLTDSPYVCDQQIVFGENLLDYTQENKGEDIITALIPLGKKNEDTDERLTVASVNDGKDYIVDTAAAAVYGLIFGTEEWDGVSNATTLLSKGREKLAELVQGQTSIQLTAVDLHLMDKDIESFDYLSYVTVKDEAHGIDGRMLVTKKTTNLSDPSQGKMTIGSESKGISRYHAQNTAQIAQAKATYATNQKVEDTKTALQSEIQTNADKIALVVQESSGNYVIKAAEIVASINETGSTVKIGADHIELTGEVIVNAINGGSTTINGSKITTGTLNASAIGAGTIDASVIGVTNINASNITTGALVVKDSNGRVLFMADTDNQEVSIAGFDVSFDSLRYQSLGQLIDISTDGVGSYNTAGAGAASLTDGQLLLWDESDFDHEVRGDYLGLKATDGTNTAALEADGGLVTATDGANTTTLNADGLSWDHGTGDTSSLRMYTLNHSSSSTAETTYTKAIPYGTYLFLHLRYTTSIAAAQGAQLVVIGQSNGASPVITLLAGGSDLTATSGTRSQVSIGTTQGLRGDATVTWTVEGRSYRRLIMVRLT